MSVFILQTQWKILKPKWSNISAISSAAFFVVLASFFGRLQHHFSGDFRLIWKCIFSLQQLAPNERRNCIWQESFLLHLLKSLLPVSCYIFFIVFAEERKASTQWSKLFAQFSLHFSSWSNMINWVKSFSWIQDEIPFWCSRKIWASFQANHSNRKGGRNLKKRIQSWMKGRRIIPLGISWLHSVIYNTPLSIYSSSSMCNAWYIYMMNDEMWAGTSGT